MAGGEKLGGEEDILDRTSARNAVDYKKLASVEHAQDDEGLTQEDFVDAPTRFERSASALVENTKKAEEMKARIRGEFGESAKDLQGTIRDFNDQIRALRLQRKEADTWFNTTFLNGKATLEQIDRDEKRITTERDLLQQKMDAILDPESVVGRKEVVRKVREGIADVVAESFAEQKAEPLSPERALRAERQSLEDALMRLPKWPLSLLPGNVAKKASILATMKENGFAMSRMINQQKAERLTAAEKKAQM